MKILIVGAGAVASVMSKFFCSDKSVSEIICGTRDLKRGREFIGVHKKIKMVKLDARDKNQIARAAKGVDLVVNASLPFFNEIIMEGALEAGANYQDMASRSDLKDQIKPERLRYHDKFKKAGLVALINTGVAPGVTNVLAREIADRFDSLYDLKFRLIEDQYSSGFVFSWSPEATLDELSGVPLAYQKGKLRKVKPFSGLEEYEFPHPIGKRNTLDLAADEISTVPRYIKVKNIDYKSGGTDIDFSKSIHDLGLFSRKPIIINGSKVVPLDLFSKIAPKMPTPKEMTEYIENGIIRNAVFVSVVEGIGKESGRNVRIKMTATYPDLKQIFKIMKGATYVSYPTGLAAWAFARIIPKIKERGVMPPEVLSAELRKEVLLELENNGVVIDKQFSKI